MCPLESISTWSILSSFPAEHGWGLWNRGNTTRECGNRDGEGSSPRGASTKECRERRWRAHCFHLCLAGWLGAEFNLSKVTGSQGDLCGSEKGRDDWFPWRWRAGRARAQTSVHLGNSHHFKATFWTVNFFFYWLPLSSWPSLMDSKLLGWVSNCLCVWN